MNGRAARRIRRASWQIIFAEGRTGNISEQRREIEKRLKREYRALPYHRRDLSHFGLVSLPHALQELRYVLRSSI